MKLVKEKKKELIVGEKKHRSRSGKENRHGEG